MIFLDGTVNGIAVKVNYLDTQKSMYLLTKEKQIRLFDNLEVAKTVARTVSNISPNIEYTIVIGNKQYPIVNSYKLGKGIYKIIDKETHKLITVKEKFNYKASNFCYIACENGENERCDREYGYKRSKELFRIIGCAIELVFVENNDEYGIQYVETYKGSEYIVHLRNNTSCIHIYTNYNLMSLNQSRKEAGEKVFPFIKSIDKFLTFYTYISKDLSEPTRINSDEKAQIILESIIDKINYIDSDIDAKIVKVDKKGYIIFSE